MAQQGKKKIKQRIISNILRNINCWLRDMCQKIDQQQPTGSIC